VNGIPVALQLSVKLGKHGLPLRSAVIVRRRRRLRIVAALAVLCVAGFIVTVTREIWPRRAEVAADLSEVFASPTPADALLATLPAEERPVYRHSIVAGGAYSRSEVADAIRKDEVVAAHYEDIDVDNVRPKTVTAARAVYVSYRVGDRVFWTRNRVRLAPGETLLTDGTSEIRARCGNLVSDHAQQPVAAEEPPVAALDETQPETGSSTIAGARDDEGRFDNVPNLPTLASSVAFGGVTPPPGVSGVPGAPTWTGGGGGGTTPFVGSGTGTGGTSLVAPQGNSERPNHGNNNGGGNNGGNNGGGNNGGGNNGGGNNGGGNNDPHGNPTTTTGDVGTTTTGGPGDDTTGSSDTTGGGNTDTTGGGNTDTTGGGTTDTTGGGSTSTTGGDTDTTGGGLTDTTGGGDTDTTGAADTTGGGTSTTGGDTSGKSVPEPATLTLLTLGAIGAASRKIRQGRP
jgi:hypothetical protein